MERIGVAVVGGGVVGCAVARELALAGFRDVFVLEREPEVGDVQSGRNSGVIHAGIYYGSDTLKAELCVQSNPLVYEFCRRHGVAAENTGKLVVACTDHEMVELEAVYAQALANGVPGLRMLSRSEVKAFEPNVEVEGAIHVPTTGVVDAAGFVAALAAQAERSGAQVLTGFEVTGVVPKGGVFEVTGIHGWQEEQFEAEVLVNAAGLGCDVIARMVNSNLRIEVIPLRGEYFRYNRRRREGLWLNGMNVYPVPEPLAIPGGELRVVGIHLTPTFAMGRNGSLAIGDTVNVGPEFSPVAERDDYESGRKPAELFLAKVKRYFPNLDYADLVQDFAGVMVQLAGVKDWIIERDARHPDCIQLLGINSPGLTGALAIARRVRRMLLG
jgi:L-2-hydroxyglutarate oxidase LhgO